MSAQLWDAPTNDGSAFTYSNGDKTVTALGTSTVGSVGWHPVADDKLYYEIKVENDSGNSNFALRSLDNNTWVYWANNGTVGDSAHGGGQIGAVGTYTTGTVIRVAVSLVSKLIWIMTDGVKWNNSTTANPATNTGGIAFSLAVDPVYLGYFAGNTGNSATLRTTAADFGFAVPAGFTAWENGVDASDQWSPYTPFGSATLSNGGKTWAANQNVVVRSWLARSAGKHYVEATVGSVAPDSINIGIGSVTNTLWTTTDDIGEVEIYTETNIAFIQTFTSGNLLAMAVDLDLKLIWFKNITTGSGWNNDILANQNPATGTGGYPIFTTSPAYISTFTSVAGQGYTLNTGKGSAFAGVLPSGFSPWADSSTSPVNASVAATLGLLTGSSVTSAPVNAAVSKTLAGLTAVSAAHNSVNAAVAQTLAPLTTVAVAQLTRVASASATLAALTTSATASASVNANAAGTLAPLTAAAAAHDSDNATAASTLASLTAVATASASVNASVGATLAALTVSAQANTGTITGVNASVNAMLDALTASAVAGNPVNAVVAATLGALSTAAVATDPDTAASASTLALLTANATASVVVNGLVSGTLAPLTASAVTSAPVNAQVASTLAALTGSAQAQTGDVISVNAAVDQTLGSLTSAVVLTNPVNATMAQTLATLTASAVAGNPVNAAVTQTLAALTAIVAAHDSDNATSSATLAALTAVATASNPVNASVNIMLAALTGSARIRTNNARQSPQAMMTI